MMSGGPGLNFNSQPDLVASNTVAIAHEVGCGSGKDMELLDCLRGGSFEQLTKLDIGCCISGGPAALR